MKLQFKKIDRYSIIRILLSFLGIAVNTVLAYLVQSIGLPLYLDTVGTIFVSLLCGLFPGVFTAVGTSLACSLFQPNSLYYSMVGVLIAICTSWFVRRKLNRSRWMMLPLILLLALIGGGLGVAVQWLVLGGPQFTNVAESARLLSGGGGVAYFFAAMLLFIVINLMDKGVSVLVAIFVFHLIPLEKRDAIRHSVWKQKPLSDEEVRSIRTRSGGERKALRMRIAAMLMATSFLLAAIMGFISVNLYFEKTRDEYTNNAANAARFAASVIDTDRLESILRDGKHAEGYLETEALLSKILQTTDGVKYLYVLRIEENGCRFLYDIDNGTGEETYVPGDFENFEEAFLPYLPALKAGEEIEPIISDSTWGWVLTYYYPVKNAFGNTVCYVGVDVSMEYLSGFLREFLVKTILAFLGFFILVVGYGLWSANHFLVYPIGSMVRSAEGFMKHIEDQKKLDGNVRAIRKLDIRTGDEVEQLYQSICDMAAGTAEQMREIRYYADATAQMQNGLIITMADLVENRDSDTGAHVQKTAAYVRIILEGLKEKGYYAGKLTPKFISDAVMSAPLHDVGKINISDAILNKPGKLTDEEYEIMKTHTVHGKEIMEKAISTVKGENYLKEARNMAAYHHERWDGKGYPEGLHGEVIPLSARVMAVADVFDALVSARVYKPAFPLEKALSILKEGAGSQFDPKCVEVFLDALPEVKQVLRKYQGS